ncbi:MAG: hypothetical protein ACI91O_000922 [Candidatus Poriferisodalaceae bacterium]|jgi:hypothetical protein
MPETLSALPLAHRITIDAAAVVVALAGFLFIRWVSNPSCSLLTAGIDDS